MKYLKETEIVLVKPKFREMVREAFRRGEKVPYGVIYLSETTLSEDEIKHAHKIIKEYKFDE